MSVKGHLKTGGCRVRGSFDVMSKRRGSALFTSKKSLCNAMKRANPVWNFRLDFDTHRVKLISCNAVWSTSHGNEPGCACYYPLEILPPPSSVLGLSYLLFTWHLVKRVWFIRIRMWSTDEKSLWRLIFVRRRLPIWPLPQRRNTTRPNRIKSSALTSLVTFDILLQFIHLIRQLLRLCYRFARFFGVVLCVS